MTSLGDNPGTAGARRGDGQLAVIAGSLTRDRICYGEADTWQIGGAVWHAATTLALLGLRTRVVTRTADRDRELVEALHLSGVEVRHCPSPETTVFINEYSEGAPEERIQRVTALADPIEAVELRRALVDADLAYLGPLHPDDLTPEAIAALHEERLPLLALDVQGFTRRVSGEQVVPEADSRLPYLLTLCQVAKASGDEAWLITGASDPAEAALELAEANPQLEVLVTVGAQGAYVARGDELYHQEAVPADVTDRTGAGDIFFAAYLAQRLQRAAIAAAAEVAARFTAKRLAAPDRVITLSA